MGRLRPRVKICGITRLEDAEVSVRLGANALGFVFWPRSPRAISREAARAIVATLPPFVTRVGVFVNMPPPDVSETVRSVGLDVVQLHGEEDPAAYAGLGVRLMRAVTIADEPGLQRAAGMPAAITPLIEGAVDERRGGTGRRADWELSARLAERRPVILAGGLSGQNIVDAIRTVQPWGVDVSSGVEHSPGIKSRDRLLAFFTGVDAAMEDQ
jgi:phosphoribosylanthranilate isomerase